MSTANGNLQGNNLYVYCFNNPVNLTDDSGNWPIWNDVKLAVKKLGLAGKELYRRTKKVVENVAEDIRNFDLYNESERRCL